MENRSNLYNVSSLYAIPYALYLIGLFFLTNIVYQSNRYAIVLITMTLLIPILQFMYTRNYRDKFTEGVIGFSHAWVFSVMLHVFAGLLFAFFLYIYTRFINKGYAVWLINEAINSIETYMQLDTSGRASQSFGETLKLLKEIPTPTPISMAIQSFWMFFNSGCFTGIAVALLVKRKGQATPVEPTTPNNNQTTNSNNLN